MNPLDLRISTALSTGTVTHGPLVQVPVRLKLPESVERPDRVESAPAPATASASAVHEPLRRRAQAKYDYVVVGAGAAGATTAARLAERGHRVLVLERGKEEGELLTSRVPAAHAVASEDPRLLAKEIGYFVKLFEDDARNEGHNNYDEKRGGFFYPRGEGLGGSTQQHAMILVRAPDVDFDRIAELTGDDSWTGKNMQQYWNVLEQNQYRPVLRALHALGKVIEKWTGSGCLKNLGGYGFDGWLKTNRANPAILLRDRQLLSLAVRTLVFSLTHFDKDAPKLRQLGDKLRNLVAVFDPNHSLTRGREGFRHLPQMTDENGERFGPRQRILSVMEEYPDRITVETGCAVDRVSFDKDLRAESVEYVDGDGKKQSVTAAREIVLSAGTFETPMILMRSGIGPIEELKKLEHHGYKPLLVRPGVGKSLSDRYEYGVVWRLKKPSVFASGATFTFDQNDRFYQEWLRGKGPYGTNGGFGAIERQSDPSRDAPNVMYLNNIGNFTGYRVGYSVDALANPSLVSQLLLDANRDDTYGALTVDPDNPMKANIYFASHEDDVSPLELDDDREVIAQSIEDLARPTFRGSRVIDEEVFPGAHVQGREALKEAVGVGTWGHHPIRTCRIGSASDPNAVCDSRFNVIGTRGLRVIDASVFPRQIGTFLVSSVMQVAEKGADVLDTEAKLADGATQTPHRLQIAERSK
ncbi:MAG: GMC family oxidoreductase [Myxococcota bacterium]